jgi:hypothetical protein
VSNVSPSDHDLAQAILSPSPAFDLFGFFCAQIERAADDRFALEQYEARDSWIVQQTERLKTLYQLAEEFAPPDLADLVAHLSWRDVYLCREDGGAYTILATIN